MQIVSLFCPSGRKVVKIISFEIFFVVLLFLEYFLPSKGVNFTLKKIFNNSWRGCSFDCKFEQKFNNPKNALSDVTSRGGKASTIAWILLLLGETPFSLILCPKYSISVTKNEHFSKLACKLNLARRFRTSNVRLLHSTNQNIVKVTADTRNPC